jgi:hypothetical protein
VQPPLSQKYLGLPPNEQGRCSRCRWKPCSWLDMWLVSRGGTFKGDNATKALAHVAKIAGKNICYCYGNIPQFKLKQYRDLYFLKSVAKTDRSLRHDALVASISDIQSRAIRLLEGKNDGDATQDNKVQVFEPPQKRPFQPPPSSTSTISSSSTRGATGVTSFFSKDMRGQDKGQLKLWRSGNPNAQEHMNMAIVDFINSNCIPFSLTEDPKFLKLIHTARQLGSFQPPT